MRKKTYQKPRLVVHGSVSELTQGTKKIGVSDGWNLDSGEGLETVS